MKTAAAACGCEFSPRKRNWPAAAATRAALERFKFQFQRERKKEEDTAAAACLPA